eukprot:2271347-Rhodomonas_salina.3
MHCAISGPDLGSGAAKAGVFLELHHNLDDMEGVRSDVAMFIQRNFPHVVSPRPDRPPHGLDNFQS